MAVSTPTKFELDATYCSDISNKDRITKYDPILSTVHARSTQDKAVIHAREIAFIDPTVSDLDSLLAGLRPDVEAVVLSGSRRATAQMANALQQRSDLDAIHIIAHGRAGEVSFGAGPLSLESLDEHVEDLRAIGQALGEHGRLSLWSCETGQGGRGADFVDALMRASGAEVAATTGLVGAGERGGAWKLDVQRCSGCARPPLTSEGIAAYAGVMANIIFMNQVAGDDYLNAQEAQSALTISGTSGGGTS